MARYIDADELVDTICEEYGVDPYYYQDLNDNLKAYTDSLILERVGTIPTADVAPVIHAHWKRNFKRQGVYKDLWLYCSNCNGRTSEEYAPYWWLYCPYCGAKMDEEVE